MHPRHANQLPAGSCSVAFLDGVEWTQERGRLCPVLHWCLSPRVPRVLRVCPPTADEHQVPIRHLDPLMEAGVGVPSASGVNPSSRDTLKLMSRSRPLVPAALPLLPSDFSLFVLLFCPPPSGPPGHRLRLHRWLQRLL